MFKPTHVVKGSKLHYTSFKDGEKVAFLREGGWSGEVVFFHPATGFPHRRDMYVNEEGTEQSLPSYAVDEINKEAV